jgi:hypothetical protein
VIDLGDRGGLEDARFSRKISSKLVSRLLVVVFSALAIFFIYSPLTATSFYSQVLLAFNIYGAQVYDTTRIAIYTCGLVTGVLLIMFFVRSGRRLRRVEELVAANCALQAFIAESTVTLGHLLFTWEVPSIFSGGSWIVEGGIQVFLFMVTWLLLIAAFALLIHHRFGRALGLTMSVISLVGNIIVLAFGLSLSDNAVSFGNMLGAPVILLVTSFMSLYYLYKPTLGEEAVKEEKNIGESLGNTVSVCRPARFNLV